MYIPTYITPYGELLLSPPGPFTVSAKPASRRNRESKGLPRDYLVARPPAHARTHVRARARTQTDYYIL